VVLCIVGLFLGFTLPASPLADWRDPLRVSALRLSTFCARTQAQAVEEGRDVAVVFDLDRQRYGLAERDDDHAAGHVLGRGVRIRAVLQPGDAGRSGRVALLFSRKGYVSPAVVQLAAADGRTMSVVLDPFLLDREPRPGLVGLAGITTGGG